VFWVPTLLAAVWIPLAWLFAPSFLFFSGTILVPWLFSIPLAVWSTDANLGAWLARHGIFACQRENWESEQLGTLVEGTSDDWWAAATRTRRPSQTAGACLSSVDPTDPGNASLQNRLS
jgi:membrane glycosyltransferase